jgi:general stress protein 26
MEEKMQNFIIELMRNHNILTLATLRDDGYPQAITVTYVNNGLKIYFATGADSQKVKNIQYSDKVSLTIDKDYDDWNKIQGLSMAATAEIVSSPDEVQKAMNLLLEKFPVMAEIPMEEGQIAVVKITPKIISVLNYEIGFGHTDLVEV